MLKDKFRWAVIGAGPAGIATVGLLLDNNVDAKDILWIDPNFKVGDFGQKWCEVSSNTSVKLFLSFLNQIGSFDYSECNEKFVLNTQDEEGFTHLKNAAEPLRWVTDNLRTKVNSCEANITEQYVKNGTWNLVSDKQTYYAEKVVLATGSTPKSLTLHDSERCQEIGLASALTPSILAEEVSNHDKVAVFGSSHSAMIIVRNLIEAGITDIANFYLEPLRYAVRMDGWTLYDNTGLKGETAKWVRQNISQNLDKRVSRYLSTKEQIDKHLPNYNKVIYATGFNQRTPILEGVDFSKYDSSTGIIAPGLFGVGIAFPCKTIDPSGNVELNVGLFKFMNDIKRMLPLWLQYSL
ncbi:hypothetical protein FLM55_07115 [Francisella sp. Scap27]|uniref:FAD-dependent oxidoreductase n=1 Tax=Francisella sp. Scap27 TaxID=2589986 RepID=UPI0015BE4455|nr:FAD-dependent oxidoreductase [Francisella sp. Scap27]QLE79518.1 hypothetical protein FLM55_07115 [Francisella sp. Scap27]